MRAFLRRWIVPRIPLAPLAVFAALSCGDGSSSVAVIVYTSLDQPFSEPILREFEQETGIQVKAVYDVEAAKTTGLVSRLAAESSRPRGDVFWSSEFAQTIMLKSRGVLAPYDSPSAEDIPEIYRDPDRYWTGFAARARVILVNTSLVPREQIPRSIFALTQPGWGQGEVAIANPLFGTSATHAAALFAALGPEEAQRFFNSLLQVGVRTVDGNSAVRDMVARGEVKVGLTDTDDAFEALEKGAPVAMILPDQDGLGTLLIPNTLALVRGGPHPNEGRRLIDYLLSREVEAKLARSGSRQMPVRDTVSVPPDMSPLRDVRGMKVHPIDVAQQMEPSSAWLKASFLR